MEERAGCFTVFVFLVSRDCCVALLHNATSLSAVCNPHKNISIIPYVCKLDTVKLTHIVTLSV